MLGSQTYAALLPLTMRELTLRAPDRGAELARALGTEPDGLEDRIRQLAGRRHADVGRHGDEAARVEPRRGLRLLARDPPVYGQRDKGRDHRREGGPAETPGRASGERGLRGGGERRLATAQRSPGSWPGS